MKNLLAVMTFMDAGELECSLCVGRHWRQGSETLSQRRADAAPPIDIAHGPYTFLELGVPESESRLSRYADVGFTFTFDMKHQRDHWDWGNSYFMHLLHVGPDARSATIDVVLIGEDDDSVHVHASLFGLGQGEVFVAGNRIESGGIAVSCNRFVEVVGWMRIVVTMIPPQCSQGYGHYVGEGHILLSISGTSSNNQRLTWRGRGAVDARAFNVCWPDGPDHACTTIRLGAKFDPHEMGESSADSDLEEVPKEVPPVERDWLFKNLRIFDANVPHFALLTNP